MKRPLHFLLLGAHPDDADIEAGGLALLMTQKGHRVTLMSATDGSAGHHLLSREELAHRRREEACRSGQALGCEYRILPIRDGELTPSLENRALLLKEIRQLAPDIIITHRCCDYHPDHRATGQLVMDCAYLLGVPLCCPEIPPLRKTPVILSSWDAFTHPAPFRADVCVAIDPVLEQKLNAMLCHESQFFEWLPWCDHWSEVEAAPTRAEKEQLIRRMESDRFAHIAQLYRQHLAPGTRYAEAYEWNEYGAPLTQELLDELQSPVP